MLNKKLASILAAGAVVALTGAIPAAHAQVGPPPQRVEIYTNAPQVDPGDLPGNWSARQNVVESQRYDQLTHTNPAFRAARIRKECGSITEPDLYQQCVATFN